MKESRKNLKLKAKRALLGRYPVAVGALVLSWFLLLAVMIAAQVALIMMWGVAAITWDGDTGLWFLLGGAVLFMVFMMVFLCMMIPGYLRLYLNICQGSDAGVLDILWGFGHGGGRFLGIGLLLVLLCLILMMPQIVLTAAMAVGTDSLFPIVFLLFYQVIISVVLVYAGLTYGQTFLILTDEPERTLTEALGESRRLMKGSRGRFFVQGLSFLGWFAVSYITFGLALLWLIPYIMCTNVFFYLNLKEMKKPGQGFAGESWNME